MTPIETGGLTPEEMGIKPEGESEKARKTENISALGEQGKKLSELDPENAPTLSEKDWEQMKATLESMPVETRRTMSAMFQGGSRGVEKSVIDDTKWKEMEQKVNAMAPEEKAKLAEMGKAMGEMLKKKSGGNK